MPNVDEIKERLSRMGKLDKEITSIEMEIQRIGSAAERITTSFSLTAGFGGYLSSKVEDGAIQLTELKNSLAGIVALYKAEYQRTVDFIMQLENPLYRSILMLRYVSCLNWESICDVLHYSDRQIFRLYDEAVETLAVNGSNFSDIV